MSEPDWTDVNSARRWLEQRYPIDNRERGSPFYRYLKDERAMGRKIEGREEYLCKDELVRWWIETPPGLEYIYRAQDPYPRYYPEYNNVNEENTLESTKHEGSDLETSDNRAGLVDSEGKMRLEGDDTASAKAKDSSLGNRGYVKIARKAKTIRVDDKDLRKWGKTLRPKRGRKRSETGEVPIYVSNHGFS